MHKLCALILTFSTFDLGRYLAAFRSFYKQRLPADLGVLPCQDGVQPSITKAVIRRSSAKKNIEITDVYLTDKRVISISKHADVSYLVKRFAPRSVTS